MPCSSRLSIVLEREGQQKPLENNGAHCGAVVPVTPLSQVRDKKT